MRLNFDRIVISLDRTPGGAYQLNISALDEQGTGHGYRIHGPKYAGDSRNVFEHQIVERDAREIRGYLDKLFPGPAEARCAAALEVLRNAFGHADAPYAPAALSAIAILTGDDLPDEPGSRR